eukprot:jgi/Mesvir1/24068/Mv10793-RA.1
MAPAVRVLLEAARVGCAARASSPAIADERRRGWLCGPQANRLAVRSSKCKGLRLGTSGSPLRAGGIVCSAEETEMKMHTPNPLASNYARLSRGEDLSAEPFISDDDDDEMWHEECGVVGVFGDPEAARLCYLSLHALQHRGQEGAGIVCRNEGGKMNYVGGLGLVSDVFNAKAMEKVVGTAAIGHNRYSTAGSSSLKNVQPFLASYRFGQAAVAHNGNIVNYKPLREMLEDNGSIFNTSSDTEVILHLIAMSKGRPFIQRVIEACEQLEGAFSLIFLTEDKMVALRDPHGYRPLVMGRDGDSICFASETCALDLIGYKYEREVQPGEVIVVDKDGISSLCLLPKKQRQACIFEHIYFALPNSLVFSMSVYQSRYEFGRLLAKHHPADVDVVIPVPDSGIVSALGYANATGVPFQQGLLRSHYVGRTFIQPTQKIRDFGVKLKLSPVKSVIEGKRVLVVDDSIVRGTTSKKIVALLRSVGATEVHMRITSPPIVGSCYYGVDTPSTEELISSNMTEQEIADFIGADSLAFLPLSALHSMLGEAAPTFCDACFTRNYAVPPMHLRAAGAKLPELPKPKVIKEAERVK